MSQNYLQPRNGTNKFSCIQWKRKTNTNIQNSKRRNVKYMLSPQKISHSTYAMLQRKSVNPPPSPLCCLKVVRIMLETWHLVRKYTLKCSFGKYTFYYQGPFNFADVSILLTKNHHFLAKIVPLLKAIVWELC